MLFRKVRKVSESWALCKEEDRKEKELPFFGRRLGWCLPEELCQAVLEGA